MLCPRHRYRLQSALILRVPSVSTLVNRSISDVLREVEVPLTVLNVKGPSCAADEVNHDQSKMLENHHLT